MPYNKIPNANNRNKCLSLDSLEARRKVFDVLMVKKILSGKVSIKTTDFFMLAPSITRGGAYKITFSKPKTSIRANHFTIRAGMAFVNLSKTILTSSDKSFKNSIKKKLLGPKTS